MVEVTEIQMVNQEDLVVEEMEVQNQDHLTQVGYLYHLSKMILVLDFHFLHKEIQVVIHSI